MMKTDAIDACIDSGSELRLAVKARMQLAALKAAIEKKDDWQYKIKDMAKESIAINGYDDFEDFLTKM